MEVSPRKGKGIVEVKWMSAENDKRDVERKTGLKNLAVYDPDHPAYQPQHLCIYLRELEEQAEAGCRESIESQG